MVPGSTPLGSTPYCGTARGDELPVKPPATPGRMRCTVARNPWMSAYLSAANRVAYTAYGQTAASARKQVSMAQGDALKIHGEAQRELMESWMDVWMPTTARRPKRRGAAPARGKRR